MKTIQFRFTEGFEEEIKIYFQWMKETYPRMSKCLDKNNGIYQILECDGHSEQENMEWILECGRQPLCGLIADEIECQKIHKTVNKKMVVVYEKMIPFTSYKLFYTDGTTEATEIRLELAEATKYYVGQSFGYWDSSTQTEKSRTVISIEIVGDEPNIYKVHEYPKDIFSLESVKSMSDTPHVLKHYESLGFKPNVYTMKRVLTGKKRKNWEFPCILHKETQEYFTLI